MMAVTAPPAAETGSPGEGVGVAGMLVAVEVGSGGGPGRNRGMNGGGRGRQGGGGRVGCADDNFLFGIDDGFISQTIQFEKFCQRNTISQGNAKSGVASAGRYG